MVTGLMGAALNGGSLMLSQVVRTWHITPESWRWIFMLAAAPAVLGSFFGAQIAAWLGRRRAYAIISAGATALTLLMFLGTAPRRASFLPIVFAQGFVATLFFGWLPLYLPELFPARVRAAGSGIAYNVGRFATGFGVLVAGALFAAMSGSYPKVGATCGLIYLLGFMVTWWAPDTTAKTLGE